jgi:catechol 2,3-dioxygenase-like lactoylglutathione lyase family enzyme
MRGDDELVALVATAQPEKAKVFYSEVLGLKLVEDSQFAIVFLAGGTTLRIQNVREFLPLPFTTLGWKVADIEATMEKLSKKGVKFERYPGLTQDNAGIWTTPDGSAKVCWFKDPDGNTLSLTEYSPK